MARRPFSGSRERSSSNIEIYYQLRHILNRNVPDLDLNVSNRGKNKNVDVSVERAQYLLIYGNKELCHMSPSTRYSQAKVRNLDLDIYNGLRLNVNMQIESEHRSSYLMDIVMSSLSAII